MYRVFQKWGVAKKQEYNGYRYMSGFEANYAAELDLRVKAKDIAGWKRQVRIPLNVNGYHICDYIIDFVVEHNDETVEYVECKGWQSEVWKLKWKLFEANYSDIPGNVLTIVQQGKMKPPKLRKIKKI